VIELAVVLFILGLLIAAALLAYKWVRKTGASGPPAVGRCYRCVRPARVRSTNVPSRSSWTTARRTSMATTRVEGLMRSPGAATYDP